MKADKLSKENNGKFRRCPGSHHTGSMSGSHNSGNNDEGANLTSEPHPRRNSPEEFHRPRQGRPSLSQLAFDWKAPDRYLEWLNFKMEEAYILQMKTYNLNDEEKVPIIKTY